MRRCNTWATVSVTSLHEPAKLCCNTRGAADLQQCRLRRRMNLPSAVATRDGQQQRIGNSVGCVVARTYRALLQHVMGSSNGFATALVASSHSHAERCCNTRLPAGAPPAAAARSPHGPTARCRGPPTWVRRTEAARCEYSEYPTAGGRGTQSARGRRPGAAASPAACHVSRLHACRTMRARCRAVLHAIHIYGCTHRRAR